jgi:hypothetical protein
MILRFLYSLLLIHLAYLAVFAGLWLLFFTIAALPEWGATLLGIAIDTI